MTPPREKTERLLEAMAWRLRLDPAEPRALGMARDGVDWRLLLGRAQAERLGGLLAYHLRRSPLREMMPPETLVALETDFRETARQNMTRFHQLALLAKDLGEAGEHVVVLQGAALAPYLYPSVGMRAMDDIDLLVPPERWPEMRGSMEGLGWRSAPGYPLLFHRDGVWLDIHLDLANLTRVRRREYVFDLDVKRFRQSAAPWEWEGERLARLAPAAHFCYLLAHFHKHSFLGLRWLVDLAYLLAEYGPQWERAEVEEWVRSCRLEKVLTVVLRVLARRLGWRPGWRGGETAAADLDPWSERVCRRLEEGRPVPFAAEMIALANVRGAARRAAFLWETAFPGPGTMAQIYPRLGGARLPLAYLARAAAVARWAYGGLRSIF